MEQRRVTETPPLIEMPADAFFKPLVIQGPRFQHPPDRPDHWNMVSPAIPGRPIIHRVPEPVQVKDARFRGNAFPCFVEGMLHRDAGAVKVMEMKAIALQFRNRGGGRSCKEMNVSFPDPAKLAAERGNGNRRTAGMAV